MKKLTSLLTLLMAMNIAFAQAPQSFNYQGVARNNTGTPLANQSISVRASIITGSVSGTVQYAETQAATTNQFGLFTIAIGSGTPVTGTITAVTWASGSKYLKIEFDPTGGTSYLLSGTTQMLSVPYALFAANAGAVGGGSAHYLGENFNGGIIFNIYKGSDGLEHGLIVALTESAAVWQTTATLVNANRTWDGAYNTPLMTGSPAATYVTSLGSGWYLPSIDELSILWHNRFYVNNALNVGGNTLLSSNQYYWSSTENGASFAFKVYFSDGTAPGSNGKTFSDRVRAVRAF